MDNVNVYVVCLFENGVLRPIASFASLSEVKEFVLNPPDVYYPLASVRVVRYLPIDLTLNDIY